MNTKAKVIQNIRNSNASVSPDVAQEYSSMTCPTNTLIAQGTQVINSNSSCPPGNPKIKTVGPLLKTTWDQGCGYNSNCQTTSNANYCYHSPTGCIATSMAQVIYYWQYPSNFNWSAMPLNYGNSVISILDSIIGKAVGMKYGNSESSASTSNIGGSLVGVFHFSSASYSSTYDYNTVVSNINNKWPVLLCGCSDQYTILGIPYSWGDCHSWVCDGYQNIQYSTYGVLMLDMNWGWGGLDNGWYGFNNWDITDPNNPHDFQYAMIWFIIFIHKELK